MCDLPTIVGTSVIVHVGNEDVPDVIDGTTCALVILSLHESEDTFVEV